MLACADAFLCNKFVYVLLLTTLKETGGFVVEFSKRFMLPYTRFESSSSMLYGVIPIQGYRVQKIRLRGARNAI